MKTFDEHVDDVIREYGTAGQVAMSLLPKEASREMINVAAKRYATEAIKEHLSRAAENARMKRTPDEIGSILVIDRESITNIDIVLP